MVPSPARKPDSRVAARLHDIGRLVRASEFTARILGVMILDQKSPNRLVARAFFACAPDAKSFIDADKESYPDYYEAALALLRPGGLIALDNMLRHGVWDEAERGFMARAVRPLNLAIRDDSRVDVTPATIGAGMTLARKR